MTDHILTINGGSSSIKFAFFKIGNTPELLFEGAAIKIGLRGATIEVKNKNETQYVSEKIETPDLTQTVKTLVNAIKNRIGEDKNITIGYRVVHGGPKYTFPTIITDEMIEDLKKCSSFAPNHLPKNIQLINIFRNEYPSAVHVACFDTAFHHDLPRVAQQLPIPRAFETRGVRRYGFHGLSYASVMEELNTNAGTKIAQGKVIIAHLGSGTSLTAVRNGKSIDTSMGFTPSSGVPMSTRSGDIDPGLMWYLSQTQKYDTQKMHEMFNFQSGLLGISETTSDMQELLQVMGTDPRAEEAVSLYCYYVKKCIGAYAAVLGGIDAVVCTGGIGENAPEIRRRICQNLEFLGIDIDEELNKKNAEIISKKTSRVPVWVIHTNEELMIAKEVQKVLLSTKLK